jgi:hypothetical protein
VRPTHKRRTVVVSVASRFAFPRKIAKEVPWLIAAFHLAASGDSAPTLTCEARKGRNRLAVRIVDFVEIVGFVSYWNW